MAPRLLAALLAACLVSRACGVVFSSESSSSAGSDYGDDADPTEVQALPGYDGALPSRHYADYITVDEAHGRRVRAIRRAGPCRRR
jgi:hypothetical protein